MTKQEGAAQESPGQVADVGTQPAPASEAAPDNPQGAETDALRRALEDAEQKAQTHYEQLLRAHAELENLRRRTERDLANAHKYALEKFALELLPVRDSLKLGLAAAGEANADVAGLREGMALTLRMLTAAMEKFGITELNPAGDRFNPELHQAMAVLPSDAEPNTVLTVHQHGYRLHDRLIRPAMVVVSGPKAESGGAPARENSGDVGQNP